jgi:hypothetical protein
MAERDYVIAKGLRMLKPGAKAARSARQAQSRANWAQLDESLASAKQQRAIKDRIAAASAAPASRPFKVNVAPRGTHGARTKPVNRDLLNDLR